jgi:hypothetical protein
MEGGAALTSDAAALTMLGVPALAPRVMRCLMLILLLAVTARYRTR